MNLEIHRVPSKTGKRNMFYPTVDGKRLNSTNYARKYDAKKLLRLYVEYKKTAN